MKKSMWIALAGLVAVVGFQTVAGAAGSHRLGVGAHYWKAVKDIDVEDVKKDGFSWVASYQYKPEWVGLELDVEWFEKGFGGSEKDVFQPQAYVILGKAIYGAAGVGGYYSDGEFKKDPFFAFRVGLDLELLPMLNIDINANYRFEKWDDLSTEGKEVNTDTITLGAAARLTF